MTETGAETLLLDLLNTTPVLDGAVRDELADPAAAGGWLARHGLPDSAPERRHLVAARDALQQVVRGTAPASTLAGFLTGASYRPSIAGDGVAWTAELPAGGHAAARAVLAWDQVRVEHPDRLRPCANPDCRLFLLDHSKPNRARWCSMAVCGNRMKARRHYQRSRSTAAN
jgi:predicted RNA-binding Zn ribbon-like protein